MAAVNYYDNHPYSAPHRVPVYPEAAYPSSARSSIVPGGGTRPQDESEDSYVEEIPRDFPPGAYTTAYLPHPSYPPPASLIYDRDRDRRRTMGDMYDSYGRPDPRRPRNDDYHYTRDEDFRRMRREGRHRHRRTHSSDSSSPSRSPSPRRRRKRKSLGDQAVGVLGGAATAMGLKSHSQSRDRYDDRDHHRSRGRHHRGRHRRDRSSSDSRSRSRSRSASKSRRKELTRTLTAAVAAGAAEAYRARKEPGGWNGTKGKRVMTAALGAGGVDKALEHGSDKHSKRHLIESTLAGLATNHLVNGPRSKSRSRHGRRARSESRGGLKRLASSGMLAAAGKKAYDHYRSRSRGRRGHSPDDFSSDDGDSRRPRRRPDVSRKRSHSVSAYLHKGLAALGLDEEDDRKGHRSSRRHDSPSGSEADDYYDNHQSSKGRRRRRRRDHSRDRYDMSHGEVSRPRSLSPYGLPYPAQQAWPTTRSHHHVGLSKYPDYSTLSFDSDAHSSSSSLGSSSDEAHTHKKLSRRRMVKAGFAAVATVNAAHEMMGSAKKRKERLKQLQEGTISPEEARKRRTKGNIKDLASLGLMGLGVKGVAEEWAEAKKYHNECKFFQSESKRRAQRRAEARERRRSLS